MVAKNTSSGSELSCFPDARQEWWYFHGTYVNAEGGRYGFMLTLLKTNPQRSEGQDPGYSCIISVLNRATGENHTVSVIDNHLFTNFLRSGDAAMELSIDRNIRKALIAEYKKSGPSKPVVLSDAFASLQEDPFEICWDFIRIKQDHGSVSLFCTIREWKSEYNFRLIPRKGNSGMPGIFDDRDKKNGMDYSFLPRLDLAGSVNGEEVQGTAWIDHQGGDFGWFLKGKKKKIIPGWDYLGVNLNDGSGLMLFVHKDAHTGEILSTYAYYLNANQEHQIIDAFGLIPVRYWQSPDTLITYPVSVQIKIPAVEAEFVFSPYTDHQEVPFFGPVRAVWQGAGQVEGTISKRPVRGEARLELNGYGYIFDFKDYLKSLGENIDRVIEGFFPRRIREKEMEKFVGSPTWKYETAAYTSVLSEPVWDLMSRSGKKWRPAFARNLLSALETDPQPYEELLYALTELNHTASLIIDDIEDNSFIRRGEETIHLRYGNELAINAANTLYFLPTLLLFEHPLLDRDQKNEIYELITRSFIKGHFGQGLDIYWSKEMNPENIRRWINNKVDLKLLQMYSFKTAAGIQSLAETTVIIAKKGAEVREACKRFAHALGVAFQIVDDVHNFSDSKEWKKTCGEDLMEGKFTYAIYTGLKETDPGGRDFLVELLCSQEKRTNKELLKQGIGIIKSSGALEKCREQAKKMVEPEWKRLADLLTPTESKILIRALTDYLLDLSFTTP